jgi:hypothetical protein
VEVHEGRVNPDRQMEGDEGKAQLCDVCAYVFTQLDRGDRGGCHGSSWPAKGGREGLQNERTVAGSERQTRGGRERDGERRTQTAGGAPPRSLRCGSWDLLLGGDGIWLQLESGCATHKESYITTALCQN